MTSPTGWGASIASGGVTPSPPPWTSEADAEEALAIVRAMATVAGDGGATPLSVMDRRGIDTAWALVFGRTPPEGDAAFEPIEPAELASKVKGRDLRLTAVRLMAVMAFVDGIVEQAKLQQVVSIASALEVDQAFVQAIAHMAADDVHWAGMDMLHHNVASIPGMSWNPEDPVSAFLPFRDGHGDPALAERYHALAHQPAGTLGNAFYHHYHDNHFAFPGEEWGVVEAWGTPHDCLHLLSGYSTSAQGELLVAVFNGASLSKPGDPFESHVLPVILTYHLGIELNKGINKGDRERMDKDPSWRDNFEGNVHLGLDPAKVWVSWARGKAMSTDLFSGTWDFWDHVGDDLGELRARYGVDPLDPAFAAVEDAQVDRNDFARPGKPLPQLSGVGIAERPTT